MPNLSLYWQWMFWKVAHPNYGMKFTLCDFFCALFMLWIFFFIDISLKFKDSYGREISIEDFLFYKWLQNIYNLSDQHHLRK